MPSSATVCGNCRNKCAKCHSSTNSSHPVNVCNDCNKKIGTKCPCCGQTKKGTIGAGKICDSCYKMNSCFKCWEHF